VTIDEDKLREAFGRLQARVELLERRQAYLERASGLFVADEELDRPKGDLKIHFDPSGWRGDSFKGKTASQCTPAFLEAYAGALQAMADRPKPGDDPRRPGYNRLDAARARSWARRLRARAAEGGDKRGPGGSPESPGPAAPAARPAGGRPTTRRPSVGRPGPAKTAAAPSTPVDAAAAPGDDEDVELAPPPDDDDDGAELALAPPGGHA
jgi:hypothetical protein